MDRPVEAWYPGDEYVDWVGISYFSSVQPFQDSLLEFARAHDKPLMIAESAPQGYDLEELTYGSPASTGRSLSATTAEEIWRRWYEPFLGFIHANADVIRAVAYINVAWNEQPMWQPGAGNGYWGDSRIQANEVIKERWLEEISVDFWAHGSPELFGLLGHGE
jgi:hypothetical protein